MVKGLKGFHIFGIVVLAIIALLAFLFASGRMSVVSVDGSKKCGADVKKLCCNKKALEAAKMHPDAIKMKCGACDCSKEGFVWDAAQVDLDPLQVRPICGSPLPGLSL